MNPIKYSILILLVVCVNLQVEAKRTQEYRYIEFQISASSDITYAIAVLDNREVVTSESQKPDFVGYVRSTTAIAWPIRTESGNSFTEDVTLTIKNAIEKSGGLVTHISTDFSMNQKDIIEKLKSASADKLLLVIINKWRSDTKSYYSKIATDMIWDISLQIFDANGEIQEENNVNGINKELNPSKTTNKKLRQDIINIYYKEKMEELFLGSNM